MKEQNRIRKPLGKPHVVSHNDACESKLLL
jgi:hypothetical protein